MNIVQLCFRFNRGGEEMKKLIIGLLVSVLVLSGFQTTTHAANTWEWSTVNVMLDGNKVPLEGYHQAGEPSYYRLRDVAEVLNGTSSQFQVTWNKKQRKMEIITGQAYVSDSNQDYSLNFYKAKLINYEFLVNGVLTKLQGYDIEGSTFFQLPDLGKLVGFDYAYDKNDSIVFLSSKPPKGAIRVKSDFLAELNGVKSEYERWKHPIHSNLVTNSDQSISAINGNDTLASLTIETYEADTYQLRESQKIAYELPLYGGFYSGKQYNYVVFGQTNEEEDNAKEVIRIVRYDKQFKRVDSVSITGGSSYTTIPFDAGILRMAENDNQLIVHTSRQRYTTSDGLNHQSQLTIIVNTANMTVTNDLGAFQKNHVSHSFDQYVAFDGNNHVLVDHGDAYPRALVLQKSNGTKYQEVNFFHIPGSIGANMTGVSIGGFEVTPNYYLLAWNSVDHSKVKNYTSYEMVGLETDQRDIMLSTLPKNALSNSSAQKVKLATYIGTDKLASIPKLVKLYSDRWMVLWQEYDLEGRKGGLKYVRVNEQGQPIEDIQTRSNYSLSEVQPIVIGNQVVWYTDEGNRTLYTLPVTE